MSRTDADARDLRVTKAEENAFYEQARSWDDDRVSRAKRSERTAWVIASGALLLLALLGGALVLMLPLKSVEPYVVRVDSSTGIVDNVIRVRDADLSRDEVLTRYFLRKYVVLRKTYTRQQLQANYDQLVLLTDPKLRPALRAEFQMASEQSPYTRYGELGTASVHIKNISFLRPNIGQVRYYVTERQSGNETLMHEIATIEFRYVEAPAGEEARAVNPLGFLVTSWRADPEAAPQALETRGVR